MAFYAKMICVSCFTLFGKVTYTPFWPLDDGVVEVTGALVVVVVFIVVVTVVVFVVVVVDCLLGVVVETVAFVVVIGLEVEFY